MTVVDVDSGAEEKIAVSSPGSATGLNLKEKQRIYFGGLPSIANYRYRNRFCLTISFTTIMEQRMKQLTDS